MIQDQTVVQEALINVINYDWEAELRHFEETFEVEIQSQDELEPWINWCKEHVEEGAMAHTFYSLMVLKEAYPDLFR